jgi:hypothetical protein
MTRPLTGDGKPMQLPRESDRELTDIDDLLHLSKTFLEDLARFDTDQLAERRFVVPNRFAEESNQLAAPGRRCHSPVSEGLPRSGNLFSNTRLVVEHDSADPGTVNG